MLGLAEPPARRVGVAIVAVIAAGALLGVAAAQPVMERMLTARARTDIEAFVVVDVSRSMLGQEGQNSPARIERAKRFAVSSFVSAWSPLRSGIDDGSGPPTPLA